MKFHKSVSQALQALLLKDFKQYTKEIPMSTDELVEVRKWVQSGHSPYENGWYISTEAGYPMDYINALRFVKTALDTNVIYDTGTEEMVIITGLSASTVAAEELPF